MAIASYLMARHLSWEHLRNAIEVAQPKTVSGSSCPAEFFPCTTERSLDSLVHGGIEIIASFACCCLSQTWTVHMDLTLFIESAFGTINVSNAHNDFGDFMAELSDLGIESTYSVCTECIRSLDPVESNIDFHVILFPLFKRHPDAVFWV
jgi:hypothetical protein